MQRLIVPVPFYTANLIFRIYQYIGLLTRNRRVNFKSDFTHCYSTEKGVLNQAFDAAAGAENSRAVRLPKQK